MENGQATDRIEKFNQTVRAAVVILLALGFVYGFIVSRVVSTESYAITFGIALTWWFASRDKKQDADEKAALAKAATSTAPTPTA